MIRQIIILLLLITFSYSSINFTKQEQEWIKNNPVVKVGGEMDWAPFDFVNNSGKYDGITKDYLDLISKKSGLKFEVITGYNWSELVSNFQKREFDILPAIYYAKDREKFGNYTTSYYMVRDYLFVRQDSKINSFEDLKGKTLAIPKGYSVIPKIKEKYPEIKILETRSIVDSIASVLSNQADATLEVHAVMTYTIKSNAIEGLKIVAQEGLGTNPLYMLVQKDKEILLSILNKSIIDINKDEQQNIADKWLTSLGVNDNLLNNEEVLWLISIFFVIVFLLLYKQRIQKEANRKIRENEKVLSEYVKMIDDHVLISITDLDGNITNASAAFCEMVGYKKEELLGKNHRIIKHADMDKSVFSDMWETITADKIWYGELKNKTKDGGYYWAKMIVSPIFNEEGEKTAYSAIRQDITDKKLVEAKTKEQNDLLSLFDHGDAVLFRWNNDKTRSTNYVSSNIENLLGFTKKEFLSSDNVYTDFIHKDDKQRVFDEIKDGEYSEDDLFKHEPYRIITKTGEIKWVLDYTVVQKDENGNITHFLGYVIDITEQENTLQNLEKFIDTQDNIVTLTDGEKITFANKKFFEFLGFDDLEHFQMNNRCICEFFVENDRFFHLGKIKEGQNWIEVMQTLPHSKRIVSMMGTDFKIHAFSITISRFDENLLIVSLTDISQTMLEHIKLEEKTIHDKLTGAYNREFFEQNYQRLLHEFTNSGDKFAIALLDIDHFKIVNDTYGHDVGDETLIHFVKTIEKYSRKNDYLIRWGGEEFVLMLRVESVDGLQKALDHLRKVIEIQEFPVIGQKTCSIGGTLYSEGEEIEATLKRADEAVYEAKKSGRNKVVLHLIH